MRRRYIKSRSFSPRTQKSNKTNTCIKTVMFLCAAAMLISWFLGHVPKDYVITETGPRTVSFLKSAIDETLNVTPLFNATRTILTADGAQDKSTSGQLIDTMLKEIPLASVFNGDRITEDNENNMQTQLKNITADNEDTPPAPAVSEENTSEKNPGNSYPIEDVTLSPTTTSGYVTLDNIYIINSTKFNIDPASLLASPLPFSYDKSKMQVLIMHTHGTESYSPNGAETYNENDSTRSLENDRNMIRVGEEMKNILESSGVNVVHDTTIHDYPSYNGSYTRALETINAQLEKYPSIQIVLDVHRDAIIDSSNKKYRPVVEYSGLRFAQMMLCMGSSQGGLEHKDWQTNLSFALKLQKKLCDTVPDIMRPIGLKKERYNQHATPGSLIIEVGSDGNSMEEALASAKIFAQAVADVLKEA